ncbi:S1 family peptidase [Nocardiopsis exhalans]|uniref:S1 family peptidase n=1 Tax=Nocardiopsis exhalans TaxID=163604 RepID=A0ABY5DGR7_9ACTN|nr:S1 family peptidase [Nocardiopsis exhalans]USY22584.1 S1 family peptidase [Nocardiopsis exhalans]
MRPSPVSPAPRLPEPRRIRHSRALAVVLGLTLAGATASAQAATTTATAETPEPAADAPAATATEALVRDLGLDPATAEQLLEAQEEALTVQESAASAAGQAYVDALFDTETLSLTVLVSDPAAVSAVEATGANTRVIDQDPAATMAALEQVPVPEGVTGWYPDTERGLVVVEALAPAAAEALVEEAGADPGAVRVVQVHHAPVTYSEIIGGRPFHVGPTRCTIGFSALASSGQGGFVTAGHCGEVGATALDSEGAVLGVFQHSRFPGSDGAFVPVGPEWTLTPWIELWSSGSYHTVTGSQQAPVGSAVCASAPLNGWRCGVIEARGQTVSYPAGTVTGLTRTTLCAEPGESGAPVVAGSQAQGVISGGSGNCATGGTAFYQEINPVLSSWGLSLVTG